ncbi:MAG: hypothetical protein BZY80_05330 [SAR202 cluster bacterium Io17-Chloro-G2]|nr:MAG: hypothetical protein BZY80_05330 [SAR202 cluster bacterium Io17-Chloro-G2]
MASERIRRRLGRPLDQLDEAEAHGWESVRALAQDVLDIDAGNNEAAVYLRSANRRLDATPTLANIQPDSKPATPPVSQARA